MFFLVSYIDSVDLTVFQAPCTLVKLTLVEGSVGHLSVLYKCEKRERKETCQLLRVISFCVSYIDSVDPTVFQVPCTLIKLALVEGSVGQLQVL